MARAYLIGGSPRCGKTSILQECVKLHPMYASATDSLRLVLRSALDSEVAPALFAAEAGFSEESILQMDKPEVVARVVMLQNEESRVLWPALKVQIEGYIKEGFDIVAEGVAIMPEFLEMLECEYRAVFVGNTWLGHGKTMEIAARENRCDWLAQYSNQAIEKFANFTAAFSQMIKEDAGRHGNLYMEINDKAYYESIHEAARYLVNSEA